MSTLHVYPASLTVRNVRSVSSRRREAGHGKLVKICRHQVHVSCTAHKLKTFQSAMSLLLKGPRAFWATCCQATASSERGQNGAIAANSTAIVWFKADLRTDDHPGLRMVEEADHILPVFCFDPQQYTQLLRIKNGLEGLLGAVLALQEKLASKGGNLMILDGKAEEIIPALGRQYGANVIVTEDEVEYRWRQVVMDVQDRLSPETHLKTWKASLHEHKPYVDDFRSFQKQTGVTEHPLQWGQLPPSTPVEDSKTQMSDTDRFSTWKRLLEETDAALLSPQIREACECYKEGWGLGHAQVVKDIAAGGELAAQTRLREFLHSDTLDAQSSEEMETAIQQSETRVTPLGSFPAIFSQAMTLGLLSRRRVFSEAQKVLAGRTAWQRVRGLLKPAQSAAVTAEAADFHWHIARSDRLRDTRTGTAPRHWRWRGFLTDYFTAVPEEFGAQAPAADAPAFLLVHGFGAFGEQWRGQLRSLAAAGHQVYAPTLPGYGRAEKPSIPYSQKLWVDFLRDFVVEVVRRPVVVAGNSIGGFLSASLAADYPQLVQGLVLINSAGLIVKGYKPEADSQETQTPAAAEFEPANASGPPAVVADVLTSALLFYLEKTISRVLTRAYPVNPVMADAWLCAEIARAARDPGAKGVFRSVFYLPKPRPINHLVADLFAKQTLILQGRKDPMQNAPRRAQQMQKLCSNVQVVLVDAGHCPFDESPEFCNRELLSFVDSLKRIPAAPVSKEANPGLSAPA